MNAQNTITISQLEASIRRNMAMIDSCQRHNAPQAAIDTLHERIIATQQEIIEIKSQKYHGIEYWKDDIEDALHRKRRGIEYLNS